MAYNILYVYSLLGTKSRALPVLSIWSAQKSKPFKLMALLSLTLHLKYFMCVSFASMFVKCPMYMQCPHRPEEGIRSHGTGVIDGC